MTDGNRTYLAKRRLDQALAEIRASPSSSSVSFTVEFAPYQLYPDFPETADKQEWHLHNKHMDNPDAQAIYQEHMKSLLSPHGVELSFDGQIGNTLPAHRLIQAVQADAGPDTANRLVEALYRRYFTQAQHPAAEDTLVGACVEAGVAADEDAANQLLKRAEEGDRELKQQMRSIAMDVDAVPVVTFEGRRRDLTLTGAKEVEAYVKAMETIIKESG